MFLDRFETHHTRRARQVGGALSAGPATAFDVTRAVYRRLPDERLMQAMTGVLGHLDLLAEDASVEAIDSGGVTRWRTTRDQ